jgi:hypothetical protein
MALALKERLASSHELPSTPILIGSRHQPVVVAEDYCVPPKV